MSGFFQKFADAFVEVEPESGDLASSVSSAGSGLRSSGDLDAITADAADLMSQLGGDDEKTAVTTMSSAKVPASANTSGPADSADSSDSSVLAMRMNPEQIFEQAGISDGTNSAHRILKLIGGLSMFPKEQQVLMIKAMDAADDTWAEDDVLHDARGRQSALRNHLKRIDSERDEFLSLLDKGISDKKAAGEKIVADIDAEIANLHDQRESAIVEMTSAVEKLVHQKTELVESTKDARQGLTEVINALSNLISFFNSTKSSPKK